jgi:hypothetical protein
MPRPSHQRLRRSTAAIALAATGTLLLVGIIPPATASTSTNRATTVAHSSASLATKSKTGSATSPIPYRFDHRRPALLGAAPKVRRAFAAAVSARIAKDLALLKAWRDSCYASAPPEDRGDAFQQVRWSGSIYRARYASVVVNVLSNPGCGGVNQSTPYSITMDLRTGKLVPLSRFAVGNSGALRSAVVRFALAQNAGCVYDDLRSRNIEGFSVLPALKNWTVSGSGISFWFPRYAIGYGACDTMRSRVPWSDILRPGQSSGSAVSSFMVGTYNFGILTVRGRKATLYLNGEGGATCLHGVRNGRQLVMYYDSDDRATWKTVGTGATRRIKGYALPTSAQRRIITTNYGTSAARLC